MSDPSPGLPKPEYTADVSVVIVNYNAHAMLERTLRTLYDSRPESTLQVIVVDNGSSDGSLDMVCERYPAALCIGNAGNVGYTRANNQGMAAASGRYLFLLNNDTILREGSVDALVRHLDAHPKVGAAGSKVLNIDGTVQGSFKALPTPMAALFGRHSILTRLFPHNRFSRRYLVYRDEAFRKPFPVGSASTCALMVRREAVTAAGAMDERFFVYWSDVDWCRAIQQAGYEVYCVPDSVIVHDEHKGGTRAARKRSNASIIDFHRGAYLYYRKWNVRRPWHPNHIAAVLGLSARALLVMVAEEIRWAGRERRKAH